MKEITRITPPTIDIEISNIVSNQSLKLTLNEYEFWTLRLEFAQGLRTFDKVKYVLDNEEGTILQDGSVPFSRRAWDMFRIIDKAALDIFMLKKTEL